MEGTLCTHDVRLLICFAVGLGLLFGGFPPTFGTLLP
jgi:hypothetical protein